VFQCFSFRDVWTSEIKLQLNNAAGGRLYFTRPHIPETEIKQNCRRSAETKPRPSAVLFHFTMCDGLNAITNEHEALRIQSLRVAEQLMELHINCGLKIANSVHLWVGSKALLSWSTQDSDIMNDEDDDELQLTARCPE